MTSSRTRFVRRAALGAVSLLVALSVHLTPAAGAPTDPPYVNLSVAPRAGQYPTGTPLLPTDWRSGEAYLGPAPATFTVALEVLNYGTDALRDITISHRLLDNGQIDGIRCAVAPASAGAAPRKAPVGNSVTWNDPDLVLAPQQRLDCLIGVSGIVERVRHHDTTHVTARGVSTGEAVAQTYDVYGLAGPSNPPPEPAVAIGQRVWLDTNGNEVQDVGEPGLAGLHLTVTDSRGRPVPDYLTRDGVVGPQTTDANGEFRFRHLAPEERYTVTLDLDAPALAELTASPPTPTWDPYRSVWSQTVYVEDWDSDAPSFGLKPKEPLKLSLDVPASAVAGTTVELTGHANRTRAQEWWDGPAVLEFRAGGTTSWAKVADSKTYRGKWHTKVTVTRSGWFRYRAPGDYYIASAVSDEHHVSVRTAPTALTAAAPSAVRPGDPLTVTGTVTRAGAPFRTGRIVLERSTDATTTWSTVADVRSTDGTLKATVDPARTGSYRFRYAGDSRTSPGTSPTRSVVVG